MAPPSRSVHACTGGGDEACDAGGEGDGGGGGGVGDGGGGDCDSGGGEEAKHVAEPEYGHCWETAPTLLLTVPVKELGL